MKIFVIGFNKCGTSSLAKFFRKNGLKIGKHSFNKNNGRVNIAKKMFSNINSGKNVLDEIDEFDVYADIELNTFNEHLEANELFREMDSAYPDAKFILNTRDKDGWIRSREHHNNGLYLRKQKRFMKIDDSNAIFEVWSKKWDDHIESVREYFSDKPGRLIEFNIEEDDPKIIADFFPELNLDIQHWGKHNANKKLRSSDEKTKSTQT